MNRGGGFHSFNLVQQMMEGSTPAAAWWSMHSNNSNSMRLHPTELIFPLLPPPSSFSSASPTTTTTTSSSSAFAQSPQPNSNPEIALWAAQDHSHHLPESWCQLLLGGIAGEDQEKYDGLNNPAYQMKKMESCAEHQHDQLLLCNNNTLKQKLYSGGRSSTGNNDQEIQVSSKSSSWSHQQIPASSPRSCITSSSFSTNMLDFSNKPIQHQPDNNSSESNSTETAPAAPAFKKSRVPGSSSPKSSLKVRKEKLGDRITALHQLVSPFGKTDTASVLQEAIGYIRFLQGQIEALSSPYLQLQQQVATASAGNMRRNQQQQQFSNGSGIKRSNTTITAQVQQDTDDDGESKKDLRSRGLCLVPVSFTMHVGSEHGADFWDPALGGGF